MEEEAARRSHVDVTVPLNAPLLSHSVILILIGLLMGVKGATFFFKTFIVISKPGKTS